MKIAVTCTGPSLDDAVEARFGRCAYFLIIDPETLDFEPIPNPNITQGGGAGIQSAQLMANKGVSLVLTGNCGPNAFQIFSAVGIQVITGVSGQVRQAVEQFNSAGLANTSAPSVQSHFGMGTGGVGVSRAMARGMGRRGGIGGGGGMGRGTNPVLLSKKGELNQLKDVANDLHNQIEVIESRIKDLDKK